MSLVFSPVSSSAAHFSAICGKELVLRIDHSPLTFEDLLVMQSFWSDAILFEDTVFSLCVLSVSESAEVPEGYERLMMRSCYATYGEEFAAPHFRAKGLSEWLQRTRFCPKCGRPLVPSTTETALSCPCCHNMLFPRIEPCIIVLVSRGDEVLLALHRHRTTQYYACIAGFIETGESAEEAVRREVMEETGISIRNIRYFGSQSWPFPASLMLGFKAEYDSGEIRVQESELVEAAWFGRTNLPATPPPGSLAYRLLNEKDD